MAITGLGYLGSSSLFSPSLSSANSLASLDKSVATSASNTNSSIVSLTPADFSSAKQVLQELPPGTVQSGYLSGTTASVSAATSSVGASSASEYGAQSSVESGSYDISYNTSLQTLQSLGLLQSGDVLTGSRVEVISQQAQLSTTQSASVSQQNGSSGDATQSSTTLTAQQTESEQNEALLVTQNWTTPNGVGFVFQEMVRFNDNTLTQQAGASSSNTSPDSAAGLDSAIAAIANAALPTIGSCAAVKPNLANSASVSGSSPLSGSDMIGTIDSNTDTYLTSSTISGVGNAATLKQADSLLALLESVESLATANFSDGQQIAQ